MKFVMYRDKDEVIDGVFYSRGVMGISRLEDEELLITALKQVGDGDEERDMRWNQGCFEECRRDVFEIDEGVVAVW